MCYGRVIITIVVDVNKIIDVIRIVCIGARIQEIYIGQLVGIGGCLSSGWGSER